MRQALPVSGLLLALLAGCSDASRSQIRIVGSSTVYPFTTAVAEQFKRQAPQYAAPVVESTGTGGGIKLLCAGLGPQFPDIADASRRIKPGEIADCRRHGVTDLVEVQIGLDGLVIAQARNGVFPGLTARQVYLALAAEPFGRGPNRARTWADIDARLPAVRIHVIGPPPTSGTRDSFDELYMQRGCETEPAMQALKLRDPAAFRRICAKVREDGAFVEGGENDNLIVQKIAADPHSIGVFGYSFLAENADRIRDVPLDGVLATYDNIASFRYPASRAMYLYVKAQHARAVPALRPFMAEYAREATWGRNGLLARRGLVASPDAVRAANALIATRFTLLDPATL